MKRVTTVLFDLDGTLLYTFEDLVASLNYALRAYGFREVSIEEIVGYIGAGLWAYAGKILPGNLPPDAREEIKDTFRRHYMDGNFDRSVRVYPGVYELVDELYRRGIKLGVLSRKFDLGVKELSRRYFGGRMGAAVGSMPGVPIKPCVGCTDTVLELLGSAPDETVYIGDSEIDLQMARESGMRCICVSWGCRDRVYLEGCGAERIADTAEELRTLLAEAGI